MSGVKGFGFVPLGEWKDPPPWDARYRWNGCCK